MKIIFLDIDGVLNSEKFYKNEAQHEKWKRAESEGYSREEQDAIANIDPESVKWLNYIINKTNAELVISSTWRFDENLKIKLSFMGIKPFIGITPKTWERHRGTEIQMWLDRHPEVFNYVILDDDCDMLDSQLNNFVNTSWLEGLNEDSANKAIKILNNGATKA